MSGTRTVSFSLLSLVAVGCNYETKDPNSNECTDIPGVEEYCGIQETGDSGTDTGEDEPSEFPSGQCHHNFDANNPDDYGWRFQCEGHLFASIEFDAPFNNDCESILGDRCHEHHVFGPSNDSYESPEVMACCGPYEHAFKDTYLEYCDYDIFQQVCISMAKRLEKLVEDGSFGVYAGQGAKLQQWVALDSRSLLSGSPRRLVPAAPARHLAALGPRSAGTQALKVSSGRRRATGATIPASTCTSMTGSMAS